jgi:glucose-6-phosphate-specific signal transduction histidine kinase
MVASSSAAGFAMTSGVPVQYFQSIIAVELAIAGALLFQVRFFDHDRAAKGEQADQVDPRLLLLMAIVLAATLFGSLEAMREGWGSWAAVFVTVGVAVSLVPILLRVLPPLARDIETQQRDPRFWVTVLGLVLYCAAVTIIVFIR